MIGLIKIIFALFLLTACNASEQTTAEVNLSKQDIPSNTLISLRRTGCFGNCPIYNLTIDANGKVDYVGWEFVGAESKVKDRIQSHINRKQLGQLIEKFEKANYFSLKDQYDSVGDGCPTYMTDAPYAITSIRLGEREKTIKHYYGCREKDTGDGSGKVYPQELYELESKIDEIVNTKQWLEK